MAGLLHLYRFAPDAWHGGLSAWCRGGGPRWLVMENAGQRRWLRRCFGAEAWPEGLEILDARGLREKLARLAGIEPLPVHAATPALIARAAGRRHAGFPRDPGPVVEA